MTEPVFTDPINISQTCRHCEKTYVMRVSLADLDKRNKGMLIQEAFPYLSADMREMFITGICGKCYDKIFGVEATDNTKGQGN